MYVSLLFNDLSSIVVISIITYVSKFCYFLVLTQFFPPAKTISIFYSDY